jgi:hypothetical protein
MQTPTSPGSPGAWHRWRQALKAWWWRLLAATLSLSALVQPSQAMPVTPTVTTDDVIAHLDQIRDRLQAHDQARGQLPPGDTVVEEGAPVQHLFLDGEPQDGAAAGDATTDGDVVAQWGNWRNWGNWGNWGNWPNWRNF